MKKVISTILALVMVLAVVATVPMTVSATAYAGQTTFSKFSQLIDQDSNSGLDAYYVGEKDGVKNTITVDGEFDDAYNNAMMFTYDSATTGKIIQNSGMCALKGDYYILWDDANLYVYEKTVGEIKGNTGDYTKASPSFSQWTDSETLTVLYILLPPTAGIDSAIEANKTTTRMLYIVPGVTQSTEVGQTGTGIVRIRDAKYRGSTGRGNGDCQKVANAENTYEYNQSKSYQAYNANNGITAVSKKTTDGYITETVIPWSILSYDASSIWSDPTASKAGQDIYVKISHDNGCHINHSVSSITKEETVSGVKTKYTYKFNGDYCGYDPVTLKAPHTGDKSILTGTSTKITADTAYWYAQFTEKNPTVAGGQTYYINNAAQLMGLSEILENVSVADVNTNTGLSITDKALLTRGNTFELTADIDLNPGYQHWEALAKFAKREMTATQIAGALPANTFKSLDAFYGTFDGKGHTINGIYNFTAASGSSSTTADFGGLIGRIGQGGVKNLIIDNGYIGDRDSGGFGGVIGSFYATNLTAVNEFFVDNVYIGSNYTVDANQKGSGDFAGGIWGGEWANNTSAKTVKVNISNCVFNGTITSLVTPIGMIGGRLNKTAGQTTYQLTVTDCIGNGNGTLFGGGVNPGATVSIVRSGIVAKATEGKVTIPEANAGYWVALNDGTAAPIKIADKYTDIKWQATVAENGKYAVRLVGELDSLNYNDAKFIVTLTGTKNGVTKTMTVDFTADKTPALAYSSLIANDQTVTADDVDFGMVEGDYFFVAVLNNLDTSVTYEVSAQAVYTLADGTVVTGVAQDLGQVAAWTNN